jgi:hypothetical protein
MEPIIILGINRVFNVGCNVTIYKQVACYFRLLILNTQALQVV